MRVTSLRSSSSCEIRQPIVQPAALTPYAVFGCTIAAAVFLVTMPLGLPALLVNGLFLFVTFLASIVVSFSRRTVRVPYYYVADQALTQVSSTYLLIANGLAVFFVLVLGRHQSQFNYFDLFLGVLAGTLFSGLSTGYILRKSGGFSLAEWLGYRFDFFPIKLLVFGCLGLISLLMSFATYHIVDQVLASLFPISLLGRSAILIALISLILLPGGFNSSMGVLFISLGLFVGLILLQICGGLLHFGAMVNYQALIYAPSNFWQEMWGTDGWHIDLATVFMIASGFVCLAPICNCYAALKDRKKPAQTGRMAAIGLLLLAGMLQLEFGIFSSPFETFGGVQKPGSVYNVLPKSGDTSPLLICDAQDLLRECRPAEATRALSRFGMVPLVGSVHDGISSAFPGFVNVVATGAIVTLVVGLCCLSIGSTAQSLSCYHFRRSTPIHLSSPQLGRSRLFAILILCLSAGVDWCEIANLLPFQEIVYALVLGSVIILPLFLTSLSPLTKPAHLIIGFGSAGLVAVFFGPEALQAVNGGKNLEFFTFMGCVIICGVIFLSSLVPPWSKKVNTKAMALWRAEPMSPVDPAS